jgi:hypothetical protein
MVYRKSEFPDLVVYVGENFVYSFPDTIIIDDDGFSTLKFYVTLTGGEDLPDWLDSRSVGYIFGTPDQKGTIELEIRADDRAGSEVISNLTIHVEGDTKVDDKAQNGQLSIYPNPAHDIIRIGYEDPTDDPLFYNIYSLDGILIQKGKPESAMIDISDLPKGFFILNLHTNKGIFTKKIVIE